MSKEGTNLAVRVLHILNALKGHSLDGKSLREVAQQTKIPEPTVTRILATMIAENYALQLDNGRYALSVRMLGIAQAHFDELNRGEAKLSELRHRVAASARQ